MPKLLTALNGLQRKATGVSRSTAAYVAVRKSSFLEGTVEFCTVSARFEVLEQYTMLSSCGTVVVLVAALVMLQTSSAQAKIAQSCPWIDCEPECRQITGSDGCLTCDCPPSCQDIKCDPGYVCELQSIDCYTIKPCYPQPICVPAPEPTRPCPSIKCARDCHSIPGANGCPTCVCPPSCKDYKCDPGYVCEWRVHPCLIPPCSLQPTCVRAPEPCALMQCPDGCRRIIGIEGCTTCDCPSCQGITCDPGYACELQLIDCHLNNPCYPQPICRPLPFRERIPCPKVDCGDPNCYALPAGYDGCAGPCICPRSTTCQDCNCTSGYVCHLQSSTKRCYSQPYCIRDPGPIAVISKEDESVPV